MHRLLDNLDRLAALQQSGLLDTMPSEVLERLTRLTSRTLGVPVALVSLVTNERQFFSSHVGLPAPWASQRETPLSHSFCQHVVTSGEPLIVNDANVHPTVADNLAIRDIGVQAYAGIPLKLTDGRTLGSFCAIDIVPRQWTPDDLQTLSDLAAIACLEIEARVRAQEIREAEAEIHEAQRRFQVTFNQAAVGFAHVAFDLRVVKVNARLSRLMQTPADVLTERTFFQCFAPSNPSDRTAFLQRLLVAGDDAVQFEGSAVGVLPETEVCVTASVARTSDGLPEYLIVVVEDITKRKRADRALLASERGLRASQEEVLSRLAQAAELRDDDTGMHTQRVGNVAAQIASALGKDADYVALLRQAAPLHDVGKIGVPDTVLLKEGPLSAAERAIIERHVAEGARILSGSTAPVIQMAETIARTHHERWDGSGYPAGLAGDAIPLSARIVAVADVFDALSHDRPYRRAWPADAVVAHLLDGCGSHFDPQVVDALLQVLAQQQVIVALT
ncbi:MAG: HD domain-containing phosphohydrolase [Gemmatimonas sp.]